MFRLYDIFTHTHTRHVKPPPPLSVEDEKVNAITLKKIEEESPWSRVKLLVTKDEIRHEPHREQSLIFWGSALFGCFGCCHAFVHAGRYGRENFIKNNQVTVYETQIQAQRLANDAYIVTGMRKGMKIGALSFLGCYALLFGAHIPEMYRCKSSSLHYTVSAAIIGTASRWVYGPRQMAIGAFCGGYIGLAVGLLITYVQEKKGWLVQDRHFRRVKAEIEMSIRYGSMDIKTELPNFKSKIETQMNTGTNSSTQSHKTGV